MLYAPHREHTNNFNSSLCPLIPTGAGVDAAVLRIHVSDGQLQGRPPLLYLVLVPIF